MLKNKNKISGHSLCNSQQQNPKDECLCAYLSLSLSLSLPLCVGACVCFNFKDGLIP